MYPINHAAKNISNQSLGELKGSAKVGWNHNVTKIKLPSIHLTGIKSEGVVVCECDLII